GSNALFGWWRALGTRDRWGDVNISVNPKSFAAVTKALSIPAPLLRSLRISIPNVGWPTDSPGLEERSIGPQADRRFQLLGGEQGNLRHLELRNTPCFFDPTPFILLTSLVLADRVRLKYQDVLDFLESCTQPEELRLADVKFIGAASHEREQPLTLPHLKQLELAERYARTEILNLYHSIPAMNCENLTLVVHGVEHLLGRKLVEGVAPVIQKTFETGDQTVLRFCYHQRENRASWEGVGKPSNGSRACGFHLGFIGHGLQQAILFPEFINRVFSSVGGATEVKLKVEDLLSGTIRRGSIGFDDVEATPTLLPNLFETLEVTEIVAEVVDGYLCYLKEFVAPDLRKAFPALRCITLHAMPPDEVVVKPDPLVKCHLAGVIDTLGEAYYGVVPREVVPTEKRKSCWRGGLVWMLLF
ncbi:hypothetical protein FRC01_007014, partial [Tulasnella sp. 417]